MKLAVIINSKAGSIYGRGDAATFHNILEAFQAHGLTPGVKILPSHKVNEATRSAIEDGAEAVVAGGGDGTISSVAEVLAHTKIPLGILPLGTHNHFAKDLGIPLSFEEAVACIAARQIQAIDLGWVNNRFFINNSSIGAYPRVVEQRDKLRDRIGGSKWLAMVISTFLIFRQFPLLNVRLNFNGTVIQRSTPFVFIGNNVYTANLFNISMRSSLNGAQLCIYMARCTGLRCLFQLFFLAMVNRLHQSKHFESHIAADVVIHPQKPNIRVAKDGEVVRLQTPLHYRSIPNALHVIVPRKSS